MEKLSTPIVPDIPESPSDVAEMRKQAALSFYQSQQQPTTLPEEVKESVETTTVKEEKGLDSMAGFSGKSSLSLLEESLARRTENRVDMVETISDEARSKILESIPINLGLIGDLI